MRLLGLTPRPSPKRPPPPVRDGQVAPGANRSCPALLPHGGAGDQSACLQVVGGGSRAWPGPGRGSPGGEGPLGHGFLRPPAAGLVAAAWAAPWPSGPAPGGGGAEWWPAFLGAARRGELAALAGPSPPWRGRFRLTLACEEVAPGATRPGDAPCPPLGDPGEACDQVHACGPLPIARRWRPSAPSGGPCWSPGGAHGLRVGACLGCAIRRSARLPQCLSEGPVLDAAREDWGRL